MVKSFRRTAFLCQIQAALSVEEQPRLQETPISPALPIEDTGLSADLIVKVEAYHEKATAIKEFGSYIDLIGQIVTELELNPSTDFPKVASILNGFRLASNKKPL